MTKVFIDKSLLEQAINTLGYYASVCGEDDQDTPAKQAQTALRAALAEPAIEPMRKHVEDFAAKAGWTKDSGEGAFEFVQRSSYAQGVEDGRNRPAQTPPAQVPMLSDDEINSVTDAQWGKQDPAVMYQAHRAYARAIEAAVRQKARL